MATKFMNISNHNKTVFTHSINSTKNIDKAIRSPSDFLNVLHIGFDKDYGDVFKAWNEDENNFTIYFGKKGSEFNQ